MLLSNWDLVLGLVTIISLVINILQYFKSKHIQHHSRGIYCQLYDIIAQIDNEGVKTIGEVKHLINQVRIEVIALNHDLGTKERIIKPWDFGVEQNRDRFRNDIKWKQEKADLDKQAHKNN